MIDTTRIEYLNWRAEGVSGDRLYRKVLPNELVALETGAVLEASPERIAPFCPVFQKCGGCQLQHWQQPPYQQWKGQLITSALSKLGIAKALDAYLDAHGAGRRRVSLHGRKTDDGVVAGFMAARSHTVVDIKSCPVLVPALQNAPDIVRSITMKVGACDVAITAAENGLDVNVKTERTFAEAQMPKLATLARELRLSRMTVNGQLTALEQAPHMVVGKAQVTLPPTSFLQATKLGEETLATLVTAAVGKAKSVADLFCGIGPFALRLAENAKLTAIDSDKPAISALKAAVKQTTGLKPITAAVRDLMREPLVANELKEFNAVVFDPPRAGAEAQAKQLARSTVKTVVAVSCDPASFARDAAILVQGGYALKQLIAVDQFKYTSHIEIVARFTKP